MTKLLTLPAPLLLSRNGGSKAPKTGLKCSS